MTSQAHSGDLLSSLRVMRMLWPAPLALQAIRVAARLDLAEMVADGPKRAASLAELTGTHAPSLARLMSALARLGIFVEDPPGWFRQNALSETLRAGHPQSIRQRAIMLGADFVWRPLGELERTIRTGEAAFEYVFGAPFFSYLTDHPDDGVAFDGGVGSRTATAAGVVSAYDFSRFERIVDVGGGTGTLLQAILTAHPRARGILYDRPTVLANTWLSPDSDVASRIDVVGGDFFEGVPTGADAYVVSRILHNWSDDAAVAVLRNCRRAIGATGRVLVLETVLTPSSDAVHAFMDLLMMVLTGGRERTEREFRSLAAQASLSVTNVIPAGHVSILECQPV
jgi:hypothetical protein